MLLSHRLQDLLQLSNTTSPKNYSSPVPISLDNSVVQRWRQLGNVKKNPSLNIHASPATRDRCALGAPLNFNCITSVFGEKQKHMKVILPRKMLQQVDAVLTACRSELLGRWLPQTQWKLAECFISPYARVGVSIWEGKCLQQVGFL